MKYLITEIDNNEDYIMYYITGASESFFVSLPINYEKVVNINVLVKNSTYTILDEKIENMKRKMHAIFDKLNQKDNLLIIPVLFDTYEDDKYTLTENIIESIVEYCIRMLKIRSIAYQDNVNLLNLSQVFSNFVLKYTQNNEKRKIIKVDSIVKSDNILQGIKNRQAMKHPVFVQTAGYVFYSFLAISAVVSYFVIMGIVFSRI